MFGPKPFDRSANVQLARIEFKVERLIRHLELRCASARVIEPFPIACWDIVGCDGGHATWQ